VFSFSPVDGRILAYVGGKDYTKSQFDRITQAIRPPGSAFKPFVYAAALEHGISPNDLIDDSPVKIGGWTPKNASGKYSGKIPVYKALMISSNVCAARMIQEVGIRAVIQTARVLGIETPLEYDYTIALGSNGVKLFEFTRAYGAFANGGYVVQPWAIERIETSRGKVVYRAPKTKISHQLSVKTAAEMTAMLKMVITNGTGRSANIGKPAAGKTGTTDKSRDAYFVGYTPNVVTGVWVGNDDNSSGFVYGGSIPAVIWRDVMKTATEPYGRVDFNYPEVELKGAGDGKLIGDEEDITQDTVETADPADNPDEKPALPDSIKNEAAAPVPAAVPVPAAPPAPVAPAAPKPAAPVPVPKSEVAPVPQ
jgi:penicillin-binding protein 1A